MLTKNGVVIEERGWVNHPLVGNYCDFRRNTCISYKDIHWIISTVGMWKDNPTGSYLLIKGRYAYETCGWIGFLDNDRILPDYNRPLSITDEADWYIEYMNSDVEANKMHDRFVNKMVNEIVETWETRNAKG